MPWPLTSPTSPDALEHATPIPDDVAARLESSIGGYIGAAPDDVKVSNVSLAGSTLSFTLTLPPYPEIVFAPLPPDVAAILAEHPTWDIADAYEERDRANGAP